MITSASFSPGRVLSVAAFGLLAVTASAQTLVSHYTLDGVGTDSGSIAVNGTLAGSAVYGASGSGVGRFDKALSSPGAATDYFTAATGNKSALGGSALTIVLWVNIDSITSGQIDRLVSNITASTGFDLTVANTTPASGVGSFALAFGFNDTSTRATSNDASYVLDKWLFLAVTYDGANIKFYSGDETTSLGLTDTAAKTGSISVSSSALEIGGTPVTPNDRNPTALFNDVSIYNGALTLSQLEALRVSAIPEPSHYALILSALSAGLLVVRGRRRRC